ncbi:hypothetical protein MY04_4502 [Flammeovirga sp. MY04]|uniref:hypothetical protein n=1 Tax=Flammeovirga sp. MY04 TaxID=1191459 RepID=UPI000806311A|nr:hypothetical protein [Flammeovirga sp. MY04]ANQ51837.1 hypothetical protein MY04_4502 [Flammeovirga sp. MY04]
MNYRNNENIEPVFFSQLYSKLAKALSQSGVVGNNPSSLLSIQIPGVTVETGLDPNDIKTQYYISNFLNSTLECNYVSTAKSALVSDVYKLILDGKETAITDLSELEKKELQKAENYLWQDQKPTTAFEKYQYYSRNFYCALDDLETATATEDNGGKKIPESVKAKYNASKVDWDTKGFKKEVEKALDTIEQLQPKERYVYWNNLNKRYNKYTKELENGSSFQYNTSIPEYKDWFKPELWTPFEFDENDYDNQSRSGGLGMTQKPCCCCQNKKDRPNYQLIKHGVLGLKGTTTNPIPSVEYNSRHHSSNLFASWNENSLDKETVFENSGADMKYKISFSFKRINIIRPWLDTNVFFSRTWRWSPISIGYGIKVSTGGSVAGNNPATGVMPVLPTTALLAKDIRFTSSDKEIIKWIENEFSQGKQVRCGPFKFDKSDKVTNSLKDAFLLSSTSAPQIFGYISTIFPECPNPDLSLKWP